MKIAFKNILWIAIFALYWCAYTYPSVIQFYNSFSDGGFLGGARGDSAIYTALLKEYSQKSIFEPRTWFELPYFYPYSHAVALTDNFLGPALIEKLISTFPLSENSQFNLILIFANILTGFSMLLLTRMLTQSILAALFSGTLFMSFPFFQQHIIHPQLQCAFVLPLSLYFTFRFLSSRRGSDALGIGVTILVAFSCSVYYSLFAALASGSLFLSAVLTRSFSKQHLKTFLIWNSLPALLLILGFLQYAHVASAFSNKKLFQLAHQGAVLSSYFSAPQSNCLWGSFTSVRETFENHLFFGSVAACLALFAIARLGVTIFSQQLLSRFNFRASLIPLALFAIILCLILFWSSSLEAKILCSILWILILTSAILLLHLRPSQEAEHVRLAQLVFVALIFLCLSFGQLGLTPGLSESEPSPFMLLRKFIPGFSGIRVPGRMGIVVVCILHLFAGVGLRNISRSIAASGLRVLFIPGFFAISYFDLQCFPFRFEVEPPAPELKTELASVSPGSPMICLPFGYIPDDPVHFVIAQTDCIRSFQGTGHSFANGLTGIMPPLYHGLQRELRNFPDEQSLRMLARLPEIHYVIYRKKFSSTEQEAQFSSRMSQYSGQIQLVRETSDGDRLLKIAPSLEITPKTELLVSKNGAALQFIVAATPNLVTCQFDVEQKAGNSEWKSLSTSLSKLSETKAQMKIEVPASDEPVLPTQLRMKINNTSSSCSVILHSRTIDSQ